MGNINNLFRLVSMVVHHFVRKSFNSEYLVLSKIGDAV